MAVYANFRTMQAVENCISDDACCLFALQQHSSSILGAIAKTPLDDPQLPRPRQSPVAPRIVCRERGFARRLAKEDRHLHITPQFFDRRRYS